MDTVDWTTLPRPLLGIIKGYIPAELQLIARLPPRGPKDYRENEWFLWASATGHTRAVAHLWYRHHPRRTGLFAKWAVVWYIMRRTASRLVYRHAARLGAAYPFFWWAFCSENDREPQPTNRSPALDVRRALGRAACHGHLETVHFLLGRHPRPHDVSRAVYIALTHRQLAVARWLAPHASEPLENIANLVALAQPSLPLQHEQCRSAVVQTASPLALRIHPF